MRPFTKVHKEFWTCPKYWALPSDNDRWGYDYLYTSPHQTMAGVFTLPAGYGASDIRWSIDRFSKMVCNVQKAGLIEHDSDTEEFWIVDWFVWNGPKNNPKHCVAIEKILARVRSPAVRTAAANGYGLHRRQFDALGEVDEGIVALDAMRNKHK